MTAVVDGTGYYKLTVTVDDSGTLPADAALLSVSVLGGGGGSAQTQLQESVKRIATVGGARPVIDIHFRVPGSKFRRIPRDKLYAFMKENGIPADALED